MSAPYEPAAKAKQVLESLGIVDPPATHLDEIAKMQNIRVGKQDLPDDPSLSGLLLFRGDKRAILINTYIQNAGRINFTFAHELGHYFLQHTPTYYWDGKQGFRCTQDDMQNGQTSKEIDANRFAAAFLMPEEQFYLGMVGSILDYTLIANLARQFRVSKHACCNRLLELTKGPYIVVRSHNFTITEIKTSSAARSKFPSLKKVPEGTAAFEAVASNRNQDSFSICSPLKWGIDLPQSVPLYEWTRGEWVSGVAMTILKW